MNSKKFHISTLITAGTGILVTEMADVYKILNFMSGESLMTHQLPRVGDECEPVLKDLYPWLAEINFPGFPDGFDKYWRAAEWNYEQEGILRGRHIPRGMLVSELSTPEQHEAQERWLSAIDAHDRQRELYQEKCMAFIDEWLEPIIEQYGEYHEVWPLHHEDHEVIDPMDEPIIQGKKIIQIELPQDEPPPEGDINWRSKE